MNMLLSIRNLKKYYPVKRGFFKKLSGYVKAVDDINLEIPTQGALGLVGESGSGKTTTARCIMRLERATSGEIFYQGKKISDLTEDEFRIYRKKIQYVFQDPYSSLNPRMTVKQIISEPLSIYSNKKAEISNKIQAALNQVGLNSDSLKKFPNEFSGGQRQRICIARSLVLDPEFLVLDEPVSALDVSIQAQILNLLQDLRVKRKFTYLFISHDLAVVRQVTDKVAVMYLGRIVEYGPTEEIFKNPKHPYTIALLNSVPGLNKKTAILKGEIPSNINPPDGCPFIGRCVLKKEAQCQVSFPPYKSFNEHKWACYVSN